MSAVGADCGLLFTLALRSWRLEESDEFDAVDAGGAGLTAGWAPRVERRTGDGMFRIPYTRLRSYLCIDVKCVASVYKVSLCQLWQMVEATEPPLCVKMVRNR